MDLTSLHEVLRVVNRNLFALFGIQMTESITNTSLSLKLLYTKFNNPELLIPSITDKDAYTNINHSYYGGRTEVYKPYGQNLKYYDVNGLYPDSVLNDLCGLEGSFVEYFGYHQDIRELFGFFYCRITVPDEKHPLYFISKYIGLLPYRNEKGGLSFPIGS